VVGHVRAPYLSCENSASNRSVSLDEQQSRCYYLGDFSSATKKKEINMRNTDTIDKLPDCFQSVEEAAEFWETHSLADYEQDLTDIEEIQAESKGVVYEFEGFNHFIVDLGKELGKQAFKIAQREGLPVNELIRIWVKEKIAQSSEG
jgi:hypothetical protein